MPTDPREDRDPGFANAYSITYRLLGDADLATAVAGEVVAEDIPAADIPAADVTTAALHEVGPLDPDEAYGSSGEDDSDHDQARDRLLVTIAMRSVGLSLQVAEPHEGTDSDDPESSELTRLIESADKASERHALRRRFAAADDTTRAAAALVQLAGYPVDEVAAVMGLTADRVTELAGPFDAPPGLNWASLGDPALRPRKVRRSRRRRRLPVFWIALGVVVVAVVLWAANSIGKRPTLQPDGSTGGSPGTERPVSTDGGTTSTVAPDAAGTSFGPDVGTLPAAGCGAPPRTAASAAQQLMVDGRSVATYTASGGGGREDLAPLLVLVSEPGLPSGQLAEASALFAQTEGYLHVAVDPAVTGDALGREALPKLLDQLVQRRCFDMNRIIVVGFGAGGVAAGQLACSAPELVAGVAMVAGWSQPSCEPRPRVAVNIVGASDDPTLDTGNALREVGSAWADALGASDERVDGRSEEALVRTWSGPGGVTVQTTNTVTGGHAWTVGASLSVTPFVQETARSLG